MKEVKAQLATVRVHALSVQFGEKAQRLPWSDRWLRVQARTALSRKDEEIERLRAHVKHQLGGQQAANGEPEAVPPQRIDL